MKAITYMTGFFALLMMSSVKAEAPVTISGPSPAIPSILLINSTSSYDYTITNNVPHASFPLSIEGLSSPVSRTTVANDCGSSLAAGPSSCHVGITLAPSLTNSGAMINQAFAASYQGRIPLKQSVSFLVPPVLAAAGVYQDVDFNQVPAFTTSINNGISWAQQVLALPAGYAGSVPNGISCSGSICVAVGASDDGVDTASEIYRSTDYGVTWSNDQVQRLPLSFAPGVVSSQLGGVNCQGNICNAVGYAAQSGAEVLYFAKSTNGGVSWSQQTLPLASSITNELLSGVSCSGNVCVAVGTAVGSDTQNFIVARSTDNGSTWTQQLLSKPSDATAATLTGVNCINSQCIAVGYYGDNLANDNMIIEKSSNAGVSWSAQTLPDPTGYTNSDLNAISCLNNRCVAVGGTSYLESYANTPIISLSTDNGNTWATQVLPIPAGYRKAVLQGVTCSAASCVAVGYYEDNANNFFQGIVVSTDQGTTWSSPQILTPPADYSNGDLNGIS